MTETERREFFRIKDRLLIEFRKISNEETRTREQHMQQADLFPGNISEMYARAASKKPEVLRDEFYPYLQLLDRKLDVIIDLLSRRDEAFQSKYLDVSISGSGIRYQSDVKLEEGDHVDIGILLPYFPNPRIHALGKVVRAKNRKVGEKDSWEIALKFIAINEKDRDILINYIFSKDREFLRAKQDL